MRNPGSGWWELERVVQRGVALALALVLAPLATPLRASSTAPATAPASSQTTDPAPYVFLLLDTTASMESDLVYDQPEPWLFEDDERSRLYIAKRALDTVLAASEGIHFGFATFPNAEGQRAGRKDPTGGWVEHRDTSGLSEHCRGWEGNGDGEADAWDDPGSGTTYNLRFPTTLLPHGLVSGDVVPLDWTTNNVDTIRERLAPNLALGELEPDYGVARYFEDARVGTQGYLKLLDERARPYAVAGLTPLARTLRDFHRWYNGWLPVASRRDPDLGDRSIALVLLTDGVEICGETEKAIDAAAGLLADTGIPTYLIAFAVDPDLHEELAEAGGTGAPYEAGDEQELTGALTTILELVRTAP